VNPFAAPFLYALDEPLPRGIVVAYIHALVDVARANGIVSSETRIIEGVASILGAPPFTVSRALEEPRPEGLSGALALLRGRPEMVCMLYRDALLIARADGTVSAEEHELLIKLSMQLGLTKRQREAATLAADLVGQVQGVMARLRDA
jgi:uncharacterized tellurite resistance protein B-like protein